jgi:radical SAM protein with 4Fe4S-binding SPASM domain
MDNLRLVLNNNNFAEYYLLLTGGEPTLHPQLPEIIDLCQSFFKGISINTNGRDSSWINRCKNNKFHVQISIDGTKTIHNKLRGNGKIDVYNDVVETINKLNNNRISYNISTTVGQNNYDNIKEMCNHISALPNVKYWKLSPVLPFGCADDTNVISVAKWNELVDYLLDNVEVRLQIKRLFDFNLLDKYMNNHPDIINFPKTNCGDVKYKVYVYPDFTVYPCTCLTDFPLGNLLNNNLNDIIRNGASKIFSNYSVNKNSVCFNCKYLSVCNGGCIGMSYHYFKKLGEGDYRCPLIQEKHHII